MNKIFMCIIVTSLFINNSFANDFLSKALSDSSNGARILNKDEEKEIVGRYVVGLYDRNLYNNELHAIMVPTQKEYELGQLCGIDQTCSNLSSYRGKEWLSAVDGDKNQWLGYSVKKNIGYSKYGKYAYFTYSASIYNASTGTAYRTNSSQLLNNNMIVKELSSKYKSFLEFKLGGLSVN